MTIEELSEDYKKQYDMLIQKIDCLRPLLCVYHGKDLWLLRKRITIYYDMACECKRTAQLLRAYIEENNEV